MTRHFAPVIHRDRNRPPTTPGARREWRIEQDLALRSDEDLCGPLECTRMEIGWPQDVWDQRIDELLDLAAELNRLDGVVGSADEFYRLHDQYAAALTRLASGPLIESFDEACAVVAEPVVREPVALRSVK